jgi:hypothetical protein
MRAILFYGVNIILILETIMSNHYFYFGAPLQTACRALSTAKLAGTP